MRDLALSATATTGLFTLIGTLLGAILGGTLTILIEVLREGERQDAKEQSANEQRTTQIQKRKTLYPELLAKGVQLDALIMNTLLTVNPQYLATKDAQPTAMYDAEHAEAFAKNVWPTVSTAMQEFQSMRSKVEMVAGEAVRQRLDQYQSDLMQALIYASAGVRKKCEGKSSDDLLLEAMQAELKDLTVGSGEDNIT